MASRIDAQVHRRLAAAFAHRLQFDERVGQRQKRRAAFKQLPEEVGAQAIAKHRQIDLVAEAAELENLVPGQELRFVDQKAVELAALQLLGDSFEQVDVG